MRTHLAVTLFLFFLFTAPLHASPWMRSEGKSLVSTSLSYSEGNQYWTDEGFLVPSDDSAQQGVYSLHYEYGYSYYYNLILGSAFKYRDNGPDVNSGISSVRVGLRGRLQRFRNGRTWQVTALLPARKVGKTPEDPGEGEHGLHVGLFYRLLPDPYEKPFTKFPYGVWGGSVGVITLRSQNAPDEVHLSVKWEKRFMRQLFGIQIENSGLSSINEDPLIAPYWRVQSSATLGTSLTANSSINVSYLVDLFGSNITQSNAIKFGYSYAWE
jgi:hypothetical protein